MNPTTLKLALSTTSALWKKIQEYRAEKSREAYAALNDAAARFEFPDIDLPDSVEKATGNVTKAARARLRKAQDEFESARAEASSAAHKVQKKAAAKLPEIKLPETKKAKKARKARRVRKSLSVAGIITVILSLGGAAYYVAYRVLNRAVAPGDTPPRVEDFSDPASSAGPESTLVYSTQTPVEGEDPVEGAPEERDEQLLNSLEEQLEKHRTAAMDEAGEIESTETEEEPKN